MNMRMKKQTCLPIALVAVCLLGGCGDAPKVEPERPVSRMEDPAYVKLLDEQMQEKKRLMKEAAAAVHEYNEAKAADPAGTSERFRAAEKRRDEVVKAVAASRAKFQRVLAERMRKDLNDSKKVQNKGN